jgi:hypothetical protein
MKADTMVTNDEGLEAKKATSASWFICIVDWIDVALCLLPERSCRIIQDI